MVAPSTLTPGTPPQSAKRRSFYGGDGTELNTVDAAALGEPYKLPARKAAATRQKGIVHRPLSASIVSVRSQVQPFTTPEKVDHRRFAAFKAMLADSGIPLALSKMPGDNAQQAALMNCTAAAVEGYADYQAAVFGVYGELEIEVADLRKLLIAKNEDAQKLAASLDKTNRDLAGLKRSSAKYKADSEAKLEQAKNKIADQEKSLIDFAVKQKQLEAALREAKRVELALSKQITRM